MPDAKRLDDDDGWPLTLHERLVIMRPAMWWFGRKMTRGHKAECGCTTSRYRKRPVASCFEHVLDRLGFERDEQDRIVEKSRP